MEIELSASLDTKTSFHMPTSILSLYHPYTHTHTHTHTQRSAGDCNYLSKPREPLHSFVVFWNVQGGIVLLSW